MSNMESASNNTGINTDIILERLAESIKTELQGLSIGAYSYDTTNPENTCNHDVLVVCSEDGFLASIFIDKSPERMVIFRDAFDKPLGWLRAAYVQEIGQYTDNPVFREFVQHIRQEYEHHMDFNRLLRNTTIPRARDGLFEPKPN